VKYLLIGAGPTALGAGHRLRALGEDDFLLLEAGNRVGGLSASHVDPRGFTWDIGGHVQFSHYEYFDALMVEALGEDGWLSHERESWVWIQDRFVPYPFQYNLRHLPPEVAWRCIEGLLEQRGSVPDAPANFREWILANFGEGIADVFMVPYNFKVWAYPPERLSSSWVGERVATIDVTRLLRNVVLQHDEVSWGPNDLFRFPRQGGTGAIWEAVADLVGREHIRLETRAASVSAESREVRTDDGEVIGFDHLLSTVPLDRFVEMVDETPAALRARAAELTHSSTNVVGIGLRGRPAPELATKCWMYFPESDCPFYRVTVFSNYSPANVPDPTRNWSLLTETSESAEKPVDTSRIVDETIAGLLATGLIASADDVVSTWLHREEYGYPTPTVDRDAILDDVVAALDALGLHSRGRFGTWRYEVSNQDHSVIQGVEWADLFASGIGG